MSTHQFAGKEEQAVYAFISRRELFRLLNRVKHEERYLPKEQKGKQYAGVVLQGVVIGGEYSVSGKMQVQLDTSAKGDKWEN